MRPGKTRTKTPDDLRSLVTIRAEHCCEYCLLHEDNTPVSHQIDHIIALKHGGNTTANNLALACIDCNRYKGSDLTAIDPSSGAIVLLFNPRNQKWDEHFIVVDTYCLGQTPTGRATAALLRFNDSYRREQRRLVTT